MNLSAVSPSLRVVHFTLLGVAAFALIALILFLVTPLFAAIRKKTRLQLSHAQALLTRSNFALDDSGIRLKKMAAALEVNSIRDELTGLYNQRYFFTTFEVEWSKAAGAGHHLAILLIDIDNFQQLIDARGQSYGDRLLRQISRNLVSRDSRQQDVAARIGPGEFALILPGSDLADSRRRAESIHAHVSGLTLGEGGAAGPLATVSIGCSSCIPQYRGSAGKMIHQAELALQQARARGANQACFPPEDEQAELAYQARTHGQTPVSHAPADEPAALGLDKAPVHGTTPTWHAPAGEQDAPALDTDRFYRKIPTWHAPSAAQADLELDRTREIPSPQLTGANHR